MAILIIEILAALNLFLGLKILGIGFMPALNLSVALGCSLASINMGLLELLRKK